MEIEPIKTYDRNSFYIEKLIEISIYIKIKDISIFCFVLMWEPILTVLGDYS